MIASTGSDEKVDYLKSELGVDVAFNYKKTSVWDVLKEHGPVDIYYDNVGEEQLDAAMKYARGTGARFIVSNSSVLTFYRTDLHHKLDVRAINRL